MGTTVLESGVPITLGRHVYARCMRGQPGGVTLLAINNSRTQPESIDLPIAAERYTLTAASPQEAHVRLNGRELTPGPGDGCPSLRGNV